MFYGCLLDKGAWWAIVHGVTELDTTEQLTHTGPDVLHLKYNDKFFNIRINSVYIREANELLKENNVLFFIMSYN